MLFRIAVQRTKRPAVGQNRNMDDGVYFEGDPATDSARRHMERVLKSPEAAPRWPWVVAALGSVGLWTLWRWGRAAAHPKDASAREPKTGGG